MLSKGHPSQEKNKYCGKLLPYVRGLPSDGFEPRLPMRWKAGASKHQGHSGSDNRLLGCSPSASVFR